MGHSQILKSSPHDPQPPQVTNNNPNLNQKHQNNGGGQITKHQGIRAPATTTLPSNPFPPSGSPIEDPPPLSHSVLGKRIVSLRNAVDIPFNPNNHAHCQSLKKRKIDDFKLPKISSLNSFEKPGRVEGAGRGYDDPVLEKTEDI